MLTPWKKNYDQPRQHIQRSQWHPTPVLLPGKSYRQRSLVGCSPWGSWVRHGGWVAVYAVTQSRIHLMRLSSSSSSRQHIKKQRHYFANKDLSSQSYGFSSSHVWMWELDCKENWVQKNWCFWTVVLENTLEHPLDSKEIQPVHPKGNKSWIFIGRTDAKAETPIIWPPNVKNWLIWKDPDSEKDWGQEEKGMTEDEMVGWHHWLNGYEFE